MPHLQGPWPDAPNLPIKCRHIQWVTLKLPVKALATRQRTQKTFENTHLRTSILCLIVACSQAHGCAMHDVPTSLLQLAIEEIARQLIADADATAPRMSPPPPPFLPTYPSPLYQTGELSRALAGVSRFRMHQIAFCVLFRRSTTRARGGTGAWSMDRMPKVTRYFAVLGCAGFKRSL